MVLFSVAEKESYVVRAHPRAALTGSRFRSAPKRCRRRSPRSAAASISRKASDASGKSGLFDLALANELYATLLAPVETLVRDKRSRFWSCRRAR